MANDVTVFGGGVAVTDEDFAAKMAQNAAETSSGGAGDSSYVTFSGKMGRYTIGQEKREPANDETYERWIVNIMSFEDGWMCWKDGKPRARRMSNLLSGVPVTAPDPDEFGPFDKQRGEGWARSKGFALKSVDMDEQASFTSSTVSAVGSMSDLQKQIAERTMAGEPRWPVIGLAAETFESQGFTNYKPVFKVVGWLSDEEMQALAALQADEWAEFMDDTVGELEVEGYKKPVAKKSRKVVEQVEEDDEDEDEGETRVRRGRRI